MTDRTISQLPPTPKLQTGRYTHFIRNPGDFLGAHHVPSPLNDVPLQAHILMLRSPMSQKAPRIFLSQGGTGVGKTTSMTNAVLAIPNTALMLVPPSVFGSKNEGGAVENFNALMDEACVYSRARRQYICILFDDMDASEMSHGENVGHTTNPIAVAGDMQNVAQDHGRYTDFTGKPVPILVSANAPKHMRPSMFRDMRAKRHTHVDDPNAKYEMVMRAFEPQGKDERAIIDRLFKRHASRTMAFWGALYADWQTGQGEEAIRAFGPDPAHFEKALGKRVPLNEAKLSAMADARRESKLGDFLFNISRRKGV